MAGLIQFLLMMLWAYAMAALAIASVVLAIMGAFAWLGAAGREERQPSARVFRIALATCAVAAVLAAFDVLMGVAMIPLAPGAYMVMIPAGAGQAKPSDVGDFVMLAVVAVVSAGFWTLAGIGWVVVRDILAARRERRAARA